MDFSFCKQCGGRVEIAEGASAGTELLCAACANTTPQPVVAVEAPIVRASATRMKPIRRLPAGTPRPERPSTATPARGASPGKSKARFYALLGGGAVVGVVAIYFAFSGSSANTDAQSASKGKTEPQAQSHIQPTTQTPAAINKSAPTAPTEVTTLAAPLYEQRVPTSKPDPEEAAMGAYTKLLTGVAESNKAERIKRLEQYLKDYPADTFAAARARVALAELKAPPQDAAPKTADKSPDAKPVAEDQYAARIDLDGQAGDIELESPAFVNGGGGIATWSGKPKCYLWSSFPATREWKKGEFKFKPSKDGVVNMHLMGQYVPEEGTKIPQPLRVFFDDISATGVELKNGDFEAAAGWEISGDGRLASEKGAAHGGTTCANVWHNGRAIQRLNVKAGVEVALTFWFKADIRSQSEVVVARTVVAWDCGAYADGKVAARTGSQPLSGAGEAATIGARHGVRLTGGQALTLPTLPGPLADGSPLALEIEVAPESKPGAYYGGLLECASYQASGVRIVITQDFHVVVEHFAGVGKEKHFGLCSHDTIPLGRFTTVRYEHDGKQARLYFDGKQQDAKEYPPAAPWTGGMRIGLANGTDYFFNGVIGNIRVLALPAAR